MNSPHFIFAWQSVTVSYSNGGVRKITDYENVRKRSVNFDIGQEKKSNFERVRDGPESFFIVYKQWMIIKIRKEIVPRQFTKIWPVAQFPPKRASNTENGAKWNRGVKWNTGCLGKQVLCVVLLLCQRDFRHWPVWLDTTRSNLETITF